DVHVDDADRADASGREVQRGRRTKAASAQQQHARVEQLELTLFADLGHEEVTLIAVALLSRERPRSAPLAALVLPLVEATVHRDDVFVAQLAERLRGERRAGATGAHDDDGLVALGHAILDLGFEVPARDVNRAGDGALLVLVGLTHVEEHRSVLNEALSLRGIYLADLSF